MFDAVAATANQGEGQGSVEAPFREVPDSNTIQPCGVRPGRTCFSRSPTPPGVVGGKQRLSTAGGGEPVWRRDGSELFYIAPGNTLMAVAVNGDNDRFEVGPVTTISTIYLTRLGVIGTPYDVAPGGQRFIFPSAKGEVSQPVTLVLNWPAELRQK